MSTVRLRGKLIPLEKIDDRLLLRTRLCDLTFLKMRLNQGKLCRYVEQLYEELDTAGLRSLRPQVYFGDEWFSPEGVPSIAVPFYLAHPRLMQLEQSMMNHVEGRTPAWFMKLIRHEAGHCFDHAYEVSGSKKWRQLFGDPEQKYRPDIYLPDPKSRDFVRNLPGYYAQSHPDEDFAETFATVVNPKSDWESKYSNWPKAFEKLCYVADLIGKHGKKRPPEIEDSDCYNAIRMRSTLGAHYQRRLKARQYARRVVSNLTDDAQLLIG
jgi:hypothetical protein